MTGVSFWTWAASEEARMHKFIVVLTAAALLAAPAFALEKRSKRTENSRLTEDTKKKDAAAEKSHKDALLHSKQMWDVLGGPRAEKPDHGYRWRLRADLSTHRQPARCPSKARSDILASR
jgi:hypothetical protein